METDSVPDDTYCGKITYETMGKLTGIFCYSVLIHNCIYASILIEARLFFIVNSVLYGIACLAFTWHIAARDKANYFWRAKVYFIFFMVFVYVGGNLWNFIYWLLLPGQSHEGCSEDTKCIESYQRYGLCIWFLGAIITSYFVFFLRDYQERLMSKYNSSKLNQILEKLNQAQQKLNHTAMYQSSTLMGM